MADDPQPQEPMDEEFEEALADARQAVAAAPDSASAQEQLGDLLIEQDPAEARRCWERAVALDPGRANAHYNLGQYHQLNDDAEAPRAHFLLALAAQPGDPAVLQKVIQSCMRLSDYSQAAEHRASLLRVLAEAPQPTRAITIDQFATDEGGRCFVLEPLDGRADLRYLYVFRFTRAGHALGTVNLETSAALRERGVYAVLGMDRYGQHTTFQLAWSTPPAYADVREAALRAWRGEILVGATSGATRAKVD